MIHIIRMISFELYARILTYGILSYVHIFRRKKFVTDYVLKLVLNS